MSTTEVAKMEEGKKDLATLGDSWGTEGIDNTDILIPKILLMQGLSEAVSEEKASIGDLINSTTTEKLGDKKTPVEIIPIMASKSWVISHREEGSEKFEFQSIVPMTPENQGWEMQEDVQIDGKNITIRRDRSLDFYVLLASEVESGEALPYMVSFRRTSYTEGKKLVTHFAKMRMLKANPAAKTLMLSSKRVENDKGTFQVLTVSPGRVTTPEEQGAAREWFVSLQKGAHRVDESSEHKREETEVASSVEGDAAEQF